MTPSKDDVPSHAQMRALWLARGEGGLRRLPGGYWVSDVSPWRGNEGMLKVPDAECVGTQTVRACAARMWISLGRDRAILTVEGRRTLEQAGGACVMTDKHLPPGPAHQRIDANKEKLLRLDAEKAELDATLSILESGRPATLAGAFAGEQTSGPSPSTTVAAELIAFGDMGDKCGQPMLDGLKSKTKGAFGNGCDGEFALNYLTGKRAGTDENVAPALPAPGALEVAMRKAGLLRAPNKEVSAMPTLARGPLVAVPEDPPAEEPIFPGAPTELIRNDGKRRPFNDDEKRRVLPAWRSWIIGPLKLERVHHPVMDDAIARTGLVSADMLVDGSGDSRLSKREDKPSPMQSLMVAHDWAAMLGGIEQVGEVRDDRGAEWHVPYSHQCFEFCITGWRVCAFVTSESNGAASSAMCMAMRGPRSQSLERLWVTDDVRYELAGDACRVLFGGDVIVRGEPEVNAGLDRLAKLVASQIRACSIFLDAQVAVTEPVRAPHRSNQPAPDRKPLPAMSHHVVQLHRRDRAGALPISGDGEGSHRRQRWHLRRGHYRHYSEHKTWIRWYAAGDWDLGVIFKEYKL